MRIKTSLLMYLSAATPVLFIPVVSCSQTMESKLESLLNDENIVDLELNLEELKKVVQPNTKITINDIFTKDVSVIKIKESQKLADWNANLSAEDKKFYTVEARVTNVLLPKINGKESEVSQLDVYLNFSAGPISNKIIKKTIDLKDSIYTDVLDIKISEGVNNFIDLGNSEPRANELYEAIRSNTSKYIKDIPSSSRNNYNFEFEEKTLTGYVYQPNLYCFGENDEYNTNIVYLTIYTADKKQEIINDIKQKYFAVKMMFNVTEFDEK